MNRSIAHRGPDEEGIHIDGAVGLGHRRLSIIDLAGGRQPMANEDGTVWITYNGEIFNYVELRDRLRKQGHRFATSSDTEVVVHAYEEYGDECVNHFNGQWAFAIWDSRKRRLFLSRDRLGVRPLYYTRQGDTFLFASEIKAILCHPEVQTAVDPIALDQIFTFWHTLPPRTFFNGICALPPAHSLVVERGHEQIRRYWSLAYAETDGSRRQDAWEDELRELLIDATRLRLRSDVSVGAYLSGGLDSSVIAAMIKRHTLSPLETFSVAFHDAEFDESPYQREVIESIRTEHHEVRCSGDDICRVFPDVIRHTETPILRTAPAPFYLLSSLVRQNGYKVVLTGEGADEMLGGYDIFKEAKIRRFWGSDPDSSWRPALLRRLYPYMQGIQAQSPAYLKAFFHVHPNALADPFFSHIPRWDLTSKLKVFFAPEIKSTLNGYDAREELRERLDPHFSQWNPFSQALWLETFQLLPGYILSSQGDRMAMAHSVEGRFPFLDYRLAEFAARMPSRLKMRGLNEKHILKRAARDLVPRVVLERPKQPYRAPDAASFYHGGQARAEYVDHFLSPRQLEHAGLFDPTTVSHLVSKARAGQAIGVKDNMALVGILSAQLCVDRFLVNFEDTA